MGSFFFDMGRIRSVVCGSFRLDSSFMEGWLLMAAYFVLREAII